MKKDMSSDVGELLARKCSAVTEWFPDNSETKETLYLLRIPGMHESLIEGLNTALDECCEELDW